MLLDHIRKIVERKRLTKQYPPHALFYADLLTAGQDQECLKNELRELARSGMIHIGVTINDYYITLKS